MARQDESSLMPYARNLPILIAAFSISLAALADLVAAAQDHRRAKGEAVGEAQHFERWLNEDAKYIISDEEREVFKKLTTAEEKLAFIEQFWLRRDPSPGTGQNEFKEEHYRRIRYANERFGYAGVPGWRTDRGMIYIKFGPPDQIESFPSGGSYIRPPHEGSGITSTFPFEIWRYRHIDGVGDDIEIEFVDDSMSGEYRIALKASDKDVFLRVPGAGLTLAEALGLQGRRDRVLYDQLNNPARMIEPVYRRVKDMPFEKLKILAGLQRPAAIKFKDLQAVVDARISYRLIPFGVEFGFLRIAHDLYLAPVTIEVENKHLLYVEQFGFNSATVEVYGRVTGIDGKIAAEFEDSLAVEFSQKFFRQGIQGRSLYQKKLMLGPGRYKLDLVIKDRRSGKIGSTQTLIIVPRIEADRLGQSSIFLADKIYPIDVERLPLQQQLLGQFLIDNLKVYPSVAKEFRRDQKLGIYFQIYNLAIDRALSGPLVEVEFAFLKNGKELLREKAGREEMAFSDRHVSVAKLFSMSGLEAGLYTVRITVTDKVSGSSLTTERRFVLN